MERDFVVGDVVKVRDGLRETMNNVGVVHEMSAYEGMTTTITEVKDERDFTGTEYTVYRLDIDNGDWLWDNNLLILMTNGKIPRKETYDSIYLNEVFNKQNMALK